MQGFMKGTDIKGYMNIVIAVCVFGAFLIGVLVGMLVI